MTTERRPESLRKSRVALVENFLATAFRDESIPPRLSEAMRYSLLAGGKRLRPVLCLGAALACAGANAPESASQHSAPGVLPDALPDAPHESLLAAVLPFAAGLEMIHTYSLIHDDLPAMDDDDLRRGRPSCHKAFDEATAILAGDALLTDAFGFMAAAPLPPERVLTAVALAAEAAGARGMVGGQTLDLAAESKRISLEELAALNAKKTGALLRAACECGAVLAGADARRREAARRFGEELGIAFQITDDILDVVGNAASLGKPVGHDAARAKPTWPALLGLDSAKERARNHCRAAEATLPPGEFPGPDADMLRHLAHTLADRTF